MVTFPRFNGLSVPLDPIKTIPKQSLTSEYTLRWTNWEASLKADSANPFGEKKIDFIIEKLTQYRIDKSNQWFMNTPDSDDVFPTSISNNLRSCDFSRGMI